MATCPKSTVCVNPSSAKTQVGDVVISYGANVPAGNYCGDFYDPSTRIHYATCPIPGSSASHSFKVAVPQVICEQAHQATQTTEPKNGKANNSRTLSVSLRGDRGTGLSAPKLKAASFKLTCKKAALLVYADPPTVDPVTPDGVATSTISVHAYSVAINGSNVIVLPAAGLVATYETDLGTLTAAGGQSGQLVQDTTNAAGTATVTIDSSDAGIANITPLLPDRVSVGAFASALKDITNPQPSTKPLPKQYVPIPVHFPPKLTPNDVVFTQATFSSTFTETPVAPSKGLSYKWKVSIPIDPECAHGFTGNKPKASQAYWFHADVTNVPKGPCNHAGNGYGPQGHPGTVTLTVTAPRYVCTATVFGTITKVGPPPPACTETK